MPKLNDISITPDQGPLLLWWQWLLVVLLVYILLKLAISYIRRCSKKKTTNCTDPLTTALDELALLTAESHPQNYFATQLSFITRRYLQQAFGDPALFETAEEFHTRSTSLELIPEDAAQKIRSYLDLINSLKYTPAISKSPQFQLIEHTSELLHAIDSTTTPPSAP